MYEKKQIALAILAELCFEKSERFRNLSMMNTPTEWKERKKAAIELANAKAEMMQAQQALKNAINAQQ